MVRHRALFLSGLSCGRLRRKVHSDPKLAFRVWFQYTVYFLYPEVQGMRYWLLALYVCFRIRMILSRALLGYFVVGELSIYT